MTIGTKIAQLAAAAAILGTTAFATPAAAASPDGVVSDSAYQAIIDATNRAVLPVLDEIYDGNFPAPAPEEEIE